MSRSLPAVLSLCSLVACAFGLSGLPAIASAATSTAAETATVDTGRVIVKFKNSSTLLTQAAGQAQAPERARVLGRRLGMTLQGGLAISDTTQVVTASGIDSKQLALKLSQQYDVEYAVEDQRRFRSDVPNDPYYGPNQTLPVLPVGQWYLRPPASDIPAAINAQGAWDVTTGNPSVVVAVLDSGVRYDHVDLTANLLPGYDMITNVPTANDGDGRDADASDPGDWVTDTEAFTRGGPFAGCTVEDSSWHGTQTAGLIAAITNNGVGMASVGRNVKVLPVRVLGKCGGYDSDIVAGMRWAVGLQVGTLPLNPNPARIINLSLGSSGSCSSAYVSALADVNATGALVVASAGNSAGHSVSTPANCSGVLAVGGLRHVGTKVGYSDVGPEIGISAPAGNCVSASGTCLYPILTTTNSGTTTPVAADATYTGGGDNASLGTSFSSPLVSATAALVWSARPGLTRDEVRQLLTSSARPFPTTGAGTSDGTTPVAACHASDGNDQLECYCTTATCGAGMLDAAAATSLATGGLYGRIVSTPLPAVATQAVTLSAATSLVATGRTIATYTWALVDGGGIVTGFAGATNGPVATVTPTGEGVFSVALTIVDSTNATSTVTRSVTVGASTSSTTSNSSSVSSGGGGGGAVDASWLALLALAAGGMHLTRRRLDRN